MSISCIFTTCLCLFMHVSIIITHYLLHIFNQTNCYYYHSGSKSSKMTSSWSPKREKELNETCCSFLLPSLSLLTNIIIIHIIIFFGKVHVLSFLLSLHLIWWWDEMMKAISSLRYIFLQQKSAIERKTAIITIVFFNTFYTFFSSKKMIDSIKNLWLYPHER